MGGSVVLAIETVTYGHNTGRMACTIDRVLRNKSKKSWRGKMSTSTLRGNRIDIFLDGGLDGNPVIDNLWTQSIQYSRACWSVQDIVEGIQSSQSCGNFSPGERYGR